MDKSVKRPILKKDSNLSRKRRLLFIKLLSEMLESGFTIQESLAFIRKVNPKMKQSVVFLEAELEKGELLYSGLKKLGYGEDVVGQIRLAEIHGDFKGSLKYVVSYLEELEKQKAAFRKVMSYPLILLLFLTGLVIGMKYLLLPHLVAITSDDGQNHFGFKFIMYAPYWILGMILLALVLYIGIKRYGKRKSAIWRGKFYMRIPFFSVIYQKYVTTLFCREWGVLLQQGLDMQTIIKILQLEGVAPLMREIATAFEDGLMSGSPIYLQVSQYHFFDKNLEQVLHQGEIKGKLGQELVIFSRLVWQDFIVKIEKWISLIQPILFLCIAVLIVSIYGSILIPIYYQGDLL